MIIRKIHNLSILTLLLICAGSESLMAQNADALVAQKPEPLVAQKIVIPHPQAAHFCQLLIDDGSGPCPLSVHAHRLAPDSDSRPSASGRHSDSKRPSVDAGRLSSDGDSLSAEQLMATYLLHRDHWRSLRIFPHAAPNGTVTWYAPADSLPASIDAEHRKYIREVFPRLQSEVAAANWPQVDAYIDRMLQYQCTFGSPQTAPRPSAARLLLIALAIIAACIALLWLVGRKTKRH